MTIGFYGQLMDVKPGINRMQTSGIIRGSTFCADGPDFRALRPVSAASAWSEVAET